MARINIEECWWSDPRRMALLLEVGFEADSAAVNMWRTAQEFWAKDMALVPKDVFDKLKHSSALIRSGLAEVREAFVYVRGSSEYLSWVAEERERARAAGKKSAESRRKKFGSAQPKGGKQDKKIERDSNENRTESNGIEPSVSVSGSNSKNDEDGKPSSPKARSLKPNKPESYSAFSDAHDLEKQALVKSAELVVAEVLGSKLSPGWRNLVPALLRSVNWDAEEFARLMGEINATFASSGDPPTLAYREVTIKRVFGLLREA